MPLVSTGDYLVIKNFSTVQQFPYKHFTLTTDVTFKELQSSKNFSAKWHFNTLIQHMHDTNAKSPNPLLQFLHNVILVKKYLIR
jgi:hypothetical protein